VNDAGHRMAMAQRELAAFVRAVTESFGPEQARISAADWLDEFESAPLQIDTCRDCRAVTIAAAARLAGRTAASRSRQIGSAPATCFQNDWEKEHEYGNTNSFGNHNQGRANTGAGSRFRDRRKGSPQARPTRSAY
jgi:hypothetical protein